jgi:hypothetical protein
MPGAMRESPILADHRGELVIAFGRNQNEPNRNQLESHCQLYFRTAFRAGNLLRNRHDPHSSAMIPSAALLSRPVCDPSR